MAYTEQSAAKLQMGLLEKLAPLSQDYLDKLEHIRGAVAHHMYEEDGNWFLDLKEKVPSTEQQRLTSPYTEEFTRYIGSSAEMSGLRSKRRLRYRLKSRQSYARHGLPRTQ